MRLRVEREQAVREAGAEHHLELQALGLVNGHHLDCITRAGSRFGLVRRGGQQRLEGSGDVGQQWLGPVHSLVDKLDRLEAFDRRTQVRDGVRALVGWQVEIDQAPDRPLFDQDRIREAGDRQAARAAEQPLPHDHRAVESIQLAVGQESHEVGLGGSFRCSTLLAPGRWRLAPWQRVTLRIPRGEGVHDAIDGLLEGPAALPRVGAQPADCPRPDPAQAGGQRALERVGVVGAAKRFEVSDEETNHLVAGRGAPPAYFIRKAQRAQSLLERRAERARAAEDDREVCKLQLWPLRT